MHHNTKIKKPDAVIEVKQQLFTFNILHKPERHANKPTREEEHETLDSFRNYSTIQ